MSDDAYLRIGHLPEDLRDLIQRLVSTDEGMETLRALGDLEIALAAERAANSDEARAEAQTTALKARDQLLLLTGVTDLEKRRLYVEAAGYASGAVVNASDFDRMMRAADRTLQAGRLRLRMAFARLALDSARLFGGEGAGAIVAQKLAHNSGKIGPLDPPDGESIAPEVAEVLDAAEGAAGKREELSGVDPRHGGLDFVKLKVASVAGELAGELYGARGDIDPEFWGMMARHFNRACKGAEIPAQRGRGFYSVKDGPSLRAIILKAGSMAADAFRKARAAKASE